MKKILTAIFIMSALIVSAQNNTLNVKDNLFKANILLTPSLDYEKGITEHSTLGIQLGTEFLVATNNVTNETEFSGLYLTLEAYYRYYYNFRKRIEKGKNISNNSANYFGISTMYIHADPIIKGDITISNNYLFVPNAVWGFQRTYWKGLNLGVELGLGYSFSNLKGEVWPITNVTLGWVFGT